MSTATTDTPMNTGTLSSGWMDDFRGCRNAYFDSNDKHGLSGIENWTMAASAGLHEFTHALSPVTLPAGALRTSGWGDGFGKLGLRLNYIGTSRAYVYQTITFRSSDVGKKAYYSLLTYASQTDASITMSYSIGTSAGAVDIYESSNVTASYMSVNNHSFVIPQSTVHFSVFMGKANPTVNDYILLDKLQVSKANSNHYYHLDGVRPFWTSALSTSTSWSNDAATSTSWS